MSCRTQVLVTWTARFRKDDDVRAVLYYHADERRRRPHGNALQLHYECTISHNARTAIALNECHEAHNRCPTIASFLRGWARMGLLARIRRYNRTLPKSHVTLLTCRPIFRRLSMPAYVQTVSDSRIYSPPPPFPLSSPFTTPPEIRLLYLSCSPTWKAHPFPRVSLRQVAI